MHIAFRVLLSFLFLFLLIDYVDNFVIMCRGAYDYRFMHDTGRLQFRVKISVVFSFGIRPANLNDFLPVTSSCNPGCVRFGWVSKH